MKKILFSLSLATLCSLPTLAKQRVVYLSQLGITPNTTANVAPRLNHLIDSLSQGQTAKDSLTLIMTPGQYYFDATHSPQREVYISNHDQVGLRSIGILIDKKTNLTLDAMGSNFIFRDRMLPIAIIDSKNTKLRGYSIDFTEPQISQVEIIQNLGKEGMTFRPAPWVRWRINEQNTFEGYGSNWKNTPLWGIVFEQSSFRTKYRTSDIVINTQGSRYIGNNIVHAPKWIDNKLSSGDIIAMRSYERPNPAVFIDNSSDTHIQKVSIHYADGMGLLAQNSHNINLDDFNVSRRGSDDPRYFTAQADATHFSGCSGHIDVRNGLFEHMMDDAINVHGVYLKLTKRIDDYTLEGQYMHEQAWGFEWAKVGDPVQFIYSKTFENVKGYNSIAKIDAVDKATTLGAKTFRIRFKQKLASDIIPETSIALENMRKIPSVTFAYNTIRNNRARGALFNTSLPVLVEYNLFDHISGSAIVSSTDCNQWFESGQTQLMHIRSNAFVDVLTSLYQFTEAVITLHPVIPELSKQKVPFYGNGKNGIIIEDNIFQTFDTPLLYAKSVKGLLWQNNTLVETNSYPKFHWNKERYKLEGSSQIQINE